ncbi:MAG: hypothetical protein E7057_10040 [Lentisphaerae bacterium]|nr:hypothetical protein [Lentisphaerota bacterium]
MKLYASIDFFSEMCFAVWTPEMLDEYFKLMKSKGISRIYWIDQKEIIQRSGFLPHDTRMRRTWANFNGDLTRAAAEIAHKNGLEIFVIIKPYESSIQQNAVSDENIDSPGVDVVGGRQRLCTDFARQHPEVMIKRQTWPLPGQKAVKFVVNFSEPLKEEGVFKVFGSDTNSGYELISERKAVPGTVNIEVPVSKWKFMVFTLEGCSGGNCYRKIVSALDADGREVPFSLSVLSNQRYQDVAYHLDIWKRTNNGGFCQYGMIFDYAPGVPSNIFTPEEVENNATFDFADAREHALGVTLELNPAIRGCPDPENQTFRNFLNDWVKEVLDHGYDGVEIRVTNHNSPVFWREYGTGREIRLARGNAHTSLLRELSAIVRGAGKKFGLHIANCMFGSSPEKSTPMEFFWDYHTWLEEKLCDEVTHKLLMSDGFSPDSLKLLEICRAKNIPVNYCRMLHGIPDPADYAGQIAKIGVDAFNIYESGTVWTRSAEGIFVETKPEQAASLWQIPKI